MEKNWLIISHGSTSDGYAAIKKFIGTEADAKKELMNEIRKERKEAENYCGCTFDCGTENISELSNDKCFTNAAWYGYSMYEDHHIDFMLFDIETIKELKIQQKC
jgi:hypothetical protein